MSNLNVNEQIELHKLATQQIIERKFPVWGIGATEHEDKYLAFYEKIYKKLVELTDV